MKDHVLTTKDVMDLVGLSGRRIREMARTGEFPKPGFKVGNENRWNKAVVEKWLEKRGEKGDHAEDPVEAEQIRADEIRKLHLHRELLKDVGGELSFRRFLEALVRDVVPKVAPLEPPGRTTIAKGCSKETMVLLLSDWHAYEEVKAERVLGFNAYNSTIFGQRSKKVIDSTLSIRNKLEQGGGWSFDRIVAACNGDFISGTIHELERHSDAPNVLMAAYAAGRVLGQSLRELAGEFQEVTVVCTSGNHGRFPDARRMQQKDPTRNWDTFVYLIARTMLEDQRNITFHIPDSYSAMFGIGPWKFLQTHGHEIKSWNQIPYYGIDRYARNINALMVAKEKPINYYLFSHFHSASMMPAPGGETIINGSLIGGNEAVVNMMGKCDRPKQMLMGVHQEIGLTHLWPLYADGGKATYDVRGWESI